MGVPASTNSPASRDAVGARLAVVGDPEDTDTTAIIAAAAEFAVQFPIVSPVLSPVASTTGNGHHVLAIGVPALDALVRERTAYYDDSFVSADPDFVHAHITVLAPWVPQPTAADLDVIDSIARATTPFEVELAEVDEFPDGVIHLLPYPDRELRELTERVAAAFPDYPAYGGAFDRVTPHLTLDRGSPSVTVATVRETVAHLLPVAVRVDRLVLQWWANHDCRLVRTWTLGHDMESPDR